MTSSIAPAATPAAGATPLSALNLPRSAARGLAACSLDTVEAIEAATDRDLLGAHRVGPGTVLLIRGAVELYRRGDTPSGAAVASARTGLVSAALEYAGAAWNGPHDGPKVESAEVLLDAAAVRYLRARDGAR